MKLIKLEVTDGGLDGFNHKFGSIESDSYHFRRYSEHDGSDDFYKNLKELNLVPKNTLIGIINRLSGEVNKFDLNNKIILDELKDAVKAAESAKFYLTKKPSLEVIGERKREMLTVNPNVELYKCTVEDMSGANEVFGHIYNEVFGTKNLGEIYQEIYGKKTVVDAEGNETEVENYDDSYNYKEELTKVLGLAEKILKNLKNNEEDKNLYSFVQKNIEKISIALSSYRNGSLPKYKKEFNFTKEVVMVWIRIMEDINKDIILYKKKFLNVRATSVLQQTRKDVLQSEKLEFVTTGVTAALKFDFNVYVTVSNELYDRISSGPQHAHFGFSGKVKVFDCDRFDVPAGTVDKLLYDVKSRYVKGFESFNYGTDSFSYYKYTISRKDEKDVNYYGCHALFTNVVGKNLNGENKELGSCSFDRDTITIVVPNKIDLREKETIKIKYNKSDKEIIYTVKKIENKTVKLKDLKKIKVKMDAAFAISKNNVSYKVKENGDSEINEAVLEELFSRGGFDIKKIHEIKNLNIEAEGKVKIQDAFSVEVDLSVKKDCELKAAKSLIFGVGRRKSYGLGMFKIDL